MFELLKLLLGKRYQSRDWIGVWYEILKERGENDQIAFIRAHVDKDGVFHESQKHQFSHAIMDGTSAIPFYFRQFGQTNSFPRKMDYIKSFSFLEILKLVFKNTKISPKNNSTWLEFDSTKKIEDIFKYAKLTLSPEQTLNFENYCLKNKISPNAILVHLFSKEILPLTKNHHEEQTWLFPVNVRGMVQKNNDDANHSSFIPIHVKDSTSIVDIQNQMKKELKSFNYLGLWWVHHISMIAPLDYLKKLSLKASQTKFWLGSFSNVGKWESTADYKKLAPANEHDAWFFATPGSKNFPISVVIMTLDERMSFSLRIHPAINKASLDKAREILDRIKISIIENYN